MNEKVMLFMGEDYYPSGGWDDFIGSFESCDLAKNWLSENNSDSSFKWAHIVKDDKIILRGYGRDSLKERTEWIWK